MTPEAPLLDDCFSEAPLVPRRLDYSESPSPINNSVELKRLEASSRLIKALRKALFLLVAKYAR